MDRRRHAGRDLPHSRLQQNSQWLDPDFPLRQVARTPRRDKLIPASIIGYGSHFIDLMRWLGGEFKSCRLDDEEFRPGACRARRTGPQAPAGRGRRRCHRRYQRDQASCRPATSPSATIPASRSASMARRVLPSRGWWSKTGRRDASFATADAVEFKQIDSPRIAMPPGTTLETPWPELYYRHLVRDSSTRFSTTCRQIIPFTTAPRARKSSTRFPVAQGTALGRSSAL